MNELEGYQLKWDEIMAVMVMAGKTEWIGLDSSETFTEEAFWNACCSLMQDGLLTQQDGVFRLCKELADLLKPMCDATLMWGITPQDDRIAQALVYVADTAVVSVVPTGYGTYSLTAAPVGERNTILCDHMALSLPELLTEEADELSWTSCDPKASAASLLNGAQYVLEAFDIPNRCRRGWMRVVEAGVYHRLQWSRGNQSIWEPLTEEAFGRAVQTLTEGGIGDDSGGCHLSGIGQND